MDAQCLLGVGDVVDEGAQYECCGKNRNAAQGIKKRKHNPFRVSYLFLRDGFRNRVIRECVRFCSICITVSMLFIGIQKKELCPFEPAIPVFLLVDGSILALHTGISAIRLCVERKKCSDSDINRLDNTSILLKILVLFLVLWNLAGSVWIYSVEKIVQFHDSIRTTYCDFTAYYFAFGLVTSAYIVVGLIIVFVLLTVTSLYIYQTCTRTSLRGIQDGETDHPDSITHI
ncbi:transmembrane protein 272-like [Haliotis rufescens]|uniref:transmembrane protein 272-like n=1 Tax=Haliotis rufescens TaxID=6454 RepID=UPI00201F105D|nr:transmembrane protein 272-like [Haliotis rufescens]